MFGISKRIANLLVVNPNGPPRRTAHASPPCTAAQPFVASRSPEDNAFTAVRQGSADRLRLALFAGANPNAITPGSPKDPLLMHAVRQCHSSKGNPLVSLILQASSNGKHADVSLCNEKHQNALHLLAHITKPGVRNELLNLQLHSSNDYKDKLLNALNGCDAKGRTPLDLAQHRKEPFVAIDLARTRLELATTFGGTHDVADLRKAIAVIKRTLADPGLGISQSLRDRLKFRVESLEPKLGNLEVGHITLTRTESSL